MMPAMPSERKVRLTKGIRVKGVAVPVGTEKVYPTAFASELVSGGKAVFLDTWVGESVVPESTATVKLNPGNLPRKEPAKEAGAKP